MLAALLLAGVALRPVAVEEPVLDVRVADIDADGREDVVAVCASALLLFRGSEAGIPAAPTARRSPPPPLCVAGTGLLGVVRDGRFRVVHDPFGAFEEGEPGARSLLGAVPGAAPALASCPGDVDGDGRDDPPVADEDWVGVGTHRVPIPPDASLTIGRNEEFAVVYRVPVPRIGDWSGAGGRELVFFHEGAVVSFRDGKETDRVPLPLDAEGEAADAIRRHHVLVEDVDRDGRLDLLVVQAKGAARLFGDFEASVLLWTGGRVYDRETRKFRGPATMLKVAGVLLEPRLTDLDGDGDLDLVLSTVDANVLAAATGTAPGTYQLFRLEDGKFAKSPAWTHRGPVPMSSFTADPVPPVVFLPDLDGDGRPEAVAMGASPELLAPDDRGKFVRKGGASFPAQGRAAIGRRLAAFPGPKGMLLAEATR